MERKYCDRCGQELPERYCNNWIRYYDAKADAENDYSGSYFRYGTFSQDVCQSCLDAIKPIFHANVATQPAGIQYVKPVVSVPLSKGCSGCWFCRSKRRFGSRA